MASFYISKCKVVVKHMEEIREKKKRGWFKYEYVPRNVYYVLCEPPEDVIMGVVFKIEVTEEKYNKITVGGEVSIHINAEYEYACFHDLEHEKKPKEIMRCKKENF